MNTVNVSRGTGWLRVWLSIASFAAIGWTMYALASHHGSAYNNLRHNDPVYFYAIVVCLLATFVAALVGIISGAAAAHAPGDARGWVFNLVLLALLGLTLFSAVEALGSIAYLA